MAQKLIQEQQQQQVQQQRLTQQQMLQVKLLEMPLTELEQDVNAQLDDNPALEMLSGEPADLAASADAPDDGSAEGNDDFEMQQEQEERQDALDAALERLGGDDEMPATYDHREYQQAEYEEIVYGNTTSFYDMLKQQVAEVELDDTQLTIIDYLIGSLDDDGLLRKPLGNIVDELAIYHNTDVSEQQVEDVLHVLQTFDPVGVGAQSLQQCLLLQIDHLLADKQKTPEQQHRLSLLRTVVDRYFEEFKKKNWGKIATALHLDSVTIEQLQGELHRLNPKPGAALGETQGRNMQQITPDFVVDTDDNGHTTFTLNHGHIPQLTVSESFKEMVETYRNNRKALNRQEKEALLYAKEKVDKAQGYIEAIRQRRHTLAVTMKAIIDWQRDFFKDGDESELRPMILKDIAAVTGLDISTVSRVSNMKYVQTRWGVFPLRYFFNDSYTTQEGEEISTRKIKVALRETIENEDKQHPLSDQALTEVMAEKGFPVARRTIAKYREQLGLPVARLRKA